MTKIRLKELILIIFIGFYFFSFAKEPNIFISDSVITGKILDKASNTILQDVSVSVIKEGIVIKGMLTDKQGKFLINLPKGDYVLEIRFMGYKTYKHKFTINIDQRKYDFGNLYLEEDFTQLETVEIQAKTTSIADKIDKKVFRIGKDLATSGASALEVLENLPAVSLDDGKVNYRGNPNVVIYIDGKPSTMNSENVLEQIPANSIKEVELISNPSARYNPEGIGGIINIILRKNATLGFHANITSGVTIGNRTSTNTSLNMNFKKGKINIFTNLGYNANRKKSDGSFNYIFNNTNEQFVTLTDKNSILAKIGFDYQINKNNTFSFYTYQNSLTIDKDKNTTVAQGGIFYNTQVLESFDDKAKIYNFNYTIDFNKKGHRLEFEVNFDKNTINQNNTTNDFLNTLSNFNYQDIIAIDRKYTISTIDYQNTLKNGLAVEIGAEARVQKADNFKQTTQINMDPDSYFEYDKNEYSFYTTIANNITKKISYKLGSRIEYYSYESFLNSNSIYFKDYTTLYPSLHLNYKLNKKNYFKIGYSKHIFRPTINEANPTNLWSSYTMTLVGNPQLKPTFVDYFEVYYRHTLKNGSITLNPFYQVNYNRIYQSISQDPNNPDKLILSYDNSDILKQYTLEYYFYYKFNTWWLLSFSGFATTYHEFGLQNNTLVDFKYQKLNTSLGQRFTINPNFRITVFAKYNSKIKTLQLEKAATGKVDIAARYSFLNGNLNSSLRFNDVFNTSDYSYIIDGNLQQTGQINLDSQSIYFSLSYKFGGKPIKNRRRKNHDKQEIDGGGIF